MRAAFETYLNKRPYRKDQTAQPEGQALLRLMNQRFQQPFRSYWERFGYEIGGPVCCAYADWLNKRIRERTDISDIAFVARDGWLLKQIYAFLPHTRAIGTHYVYAPRTMTLLCQNTERLDSYRRYLNSLSFNDGTVAVVDTVTMKFSSQRLIDSALDNQTLGFYWVVLHSKEQFGKAYEYLSFQREAYHTIRNWNLMEFIMTSPEPSIRSLEDGKPAFRDADASEKERETLFLDMEAGVLAFARDLYTGGEPLEISNGFITKWVNAFLKNPDAEDKAAFQNVLISELEDHSDRIPLAPFSGGGIIRSPKELKDRLWLYSQRHELLYRFLHKGNILYKRLSDRFHGLSYMTYSGGDSERMASLLAGYDVVSFDIFDTLILRPVEKPTDVFRSLEKQNGLFDFYDNRIQAEKAARNRSSSGEVGILDIYDELAPKYGQTAEEMAACEMDEEKKMCYANPDLLKLYDILKEKGVRMIAVSDMYLPSGYLRELLSGCGYTAIGPVFVSCEYGVGKTGGALQHIVQAELGDSLRYIHIGDNLDSDVRGSITAGWSALRYLRKVRSLQ